VYLDLNGIITRTNIKIMVKSLVIDKFIDDICCQFSDEYETKQYLLRKLQAWYAFKYHRQMNEYERRIYYALLSDGSNEYKLQMITIITSN
jgi:hypothetical protein